MTALTGQPGTSPRPASGSSVVIGTLLVAAGAVLLLVEAGLLVSPWPAIPALLLVMVGGAVAVAGLRGFWHGTLVGLGVILTLITALSTTAANSWNVATAGVGERVYAPVDVAELDEGYELGAGTLRFDLRELALPEGTTRLSVDVGAGEIAVRVPADVALEVTAGSGTGDIDILGDRRGGLGVDHRYASEGFEQSERRLQLDLSVGIGQIEVTR